MDGTGKNHPECGKSDPERQISHFFIICGCRFVFLDMHVSFGIHRDEEASNGP